MKAGYLTTLAGRALGATPVLQPPVPSRFEPESQHAELTEATHIMESPIVSDDVGIVARTRSAPVISPGGLPLGGDELHTASEGMAGLPANPAAPARHDSSAARAGARGRRVPRFPAPVSDDARTSPAGLNPYETARETGLLVPGVAAAESMLSGEPAMLGGDADLAQAGRRVLDGRRGTARRETAASEPAVVVHIGRIEVRAVQAPRPPVAAPRPRPAAAALPSLADYLLARDRGRQ